MFRVIHMMNSVGPGAMSVKKERGERERERGREDQNESELYMYIISHCTQGWF